MAVVYERNNRLEEDLPGEIYKPVRYYGVIYEKYSISQYGTVIGPRGKLKWFEKSKSSPYPTVCLYPNENKTEKMERLHMGRSYVFVHRIVAETHLPISENLPYEFQDIRRYLTEEHYNILERLFNIDHIDGDKSNPHVDNLQWVTPGQNHPVNKEYFLKGLD